MNKTYTVDAVVLKTVPYGENDSLVTLLTSERGRITVIAKGARSLRSQIRGGIQPYHYGNFEIASGKGPGWIRSLQISESFLGMRTKLLPLSLAAYLSEVAYELSGEGEPAEELTRLLLNTFYMLSERIDGTDELSVLRVKAAFELRVMAISGYLPDLAACGRCGVRDDGAPHYLDVMNGALICPSCIAKASAQHLPPPDPHETGTATILLPVLPETLAVMRYVVEAPQKRVYLYQLENEDAVRNFSKVAQSYLEHHLERTFESLHFFHSLL